MKKLLTIIIIIIIVIIFFLFFFSTGSTDPALKPKGSLRNLARVRIDLGGRVCTQRAGLHLARGSASQMLGAANPKITALQTRSPWGCSQARGFAHSTQGWADPAPSVYMLGPQLALAPGVFSLGHGQARVADPTPRLGSPSARCLQPYHAPTKQCNL